MNQLVLETNGQYEVVNQWIEKNKIKRLMLVCGKSIYRQSVNDYIEEQKRRLGFEIIRFMDFQPNPLYENVIKGVELFREKNCDGIMAIGGGSAIDVAKCIKLYNNMPGNGKNGEYLEQKIKKNTIPFLAMPTTAGTGSEATRYAVIYYEGKKQSISDESCIPGTVVLDSSLLNTLPEYQRKSSMLDALCHAIESFWSVNSTEKSRIYSRKAIEMIFENVNSYLANTEEGNVGMLRASNLAGKAINITQTTAGHAMCYKITSMFGCAHGHAAALCDKVLFRWMNDNIDKCIDIRGKKYLTDILDEIGSAMGCQDRVDGAKKFDVFFDSLDLEVPVATEQQLQELTMSVNIVRLKNHPIKLKEADIENLYHNILNGDV